MKLNQMLLAYKQKIDAVVPNFQQYMHIFFDLRSNGSKSHTCKWTSATLIKLIIEVYYEVYYEV